MTRHRVDPSRGGKDGDYRDGYRAGAAYARQHRGGGGMPPRRGCPLTALLILAFVLLPPLWPLAVAFVVTAAGSGWALGRRNPEHQPDRPVSDWLHDRLDGAEPAPKHTTDSDPDGWHLGRRTGTPKDDR